MGGESATAMPSVTSGDKMIHPTFHFNHSDEVKIPKEGTATIKFRRKRTELDESDPSDPKYSHELEVHGIEVCPDCAEQEKPIDQLKQGMRKSLGVEGK